ncbi:uncharacterized protein ATNIH1004_004526 [Aspergillus tanneri]|uniref:FAD-binding domain-containing protein n=1 Tax=Aspergillus tanneri TaxID=1220188 RepID=A0A5M9MNM0_9EURO|nr:uncharacterized protein ATNIH1004_004526 [Aspergillus tanneri]KAA8648641.1 hypothetical protein ATNIH1004_004526 [Aspergillus tanneri]
MLDHQQHLTQKDGSCWPVTVHKVTPNIALSGNSATESVAVLCNHLRRTVLAHQGGKVSQAALRKVFETYQAEREERMYEILKLSSLITRVQALDGLAMKLLATWVLPFQVDHKLTDQMGELISAAPKLGYVDVSRGFALGKLPWKDEIETYTATPKGALFSRLLVYLAGGLTALIVAYALSV